MQSKHVLRLLSVLTLAIAPMAHADDYGCKVLLCLSDPRGPTTEPACRPPIEQLYKDLAKGRAFPTCAMASGPNGRSYAQQGYSYYDSCPPGTTELPSMERAALKTDKPHGYWNPYKDEELYVGIGSGNEITRSWDSQESMPGKVCVGRVVGKGTAGVGENAYEVKLYDRIEIVQAARSPRYIDVFVNNEFFRRVRW